MRLPGPLRAAGRAYRATGADLPFGDLLAAHGVAMEGYFWRITDRERGRVVIALIGVNRDADGAHWATLGLGGHPNGFLRTAEHPAAAADPERLGATAGTAFAGAGDAVRVDLGPDARLELRVREPRGWPRRSLGGSSVFQSVPALNQYWHPWLLGGRADGVATLGDEEWRFDGVQVYAEKNWGRGGFPDEWWWGQAHGFDEPGACVAFAGGQVHAGPLRTEVTGLVVTLPGGPTFRLGNPVISPVQARVSDEQWQLRGRGYGWEVEIDGHAPLGAAHLLPVPLPAERRNVAGALEHLGATMAVVVRRRGRTVWSGASTLAALEHGGLERAAAEARRRGAPPGASAAAPVAF